MNYDKAYFIAKFEAIPEGQWCERAYFNAIGQHCALGHCGESTGVTEESGALTSLLSLGLGSSTSRINDGEHPDYRQPTPKQRILAALHDLP